MGHSPWGFRFSGATRFRERRRSVRGQRSRCYDARPVREGEWNRTESRLRAGCVRENKPGRWVRSADVEGAGEGHASERVKWRVLRDFDDRITMPGANHEIGAGD